MEALDPLASAFWIDIASAVFCGAIVGLERRLKGKPAGMRTSILICLATFLFVRLGVAVGAPGSDPTRVLGQVVTGIGFLGAGVIMAQQGLVMGVTSAAVIWVLAAIGAAIGLGYHSTAIVCALLIVVILRGVEVIEERLTSFPNGNNDATRYQKRGDD